MMEAASTYETSENFSQSTRRYSPEDSHLHMTAMGTSNPAFITVLTKASQ
jgi:hypothetical protein